MKTLILAAGRGERMRPLTDHTPKPLLRAGGKPLIVWHLERLRACGLRDVVINHAHLGEQIEAALGDGSAFGLAIRYSPEPPGALETAGAVAQARPLLGDEPFLLVNGDVWCDWDVGRAPAIAGALAERGHLAHLVLVDNPQHHAGGDFCLDAATLRYASSACGPTLTYSGSGVYSPALFAGVKAGTVLKMRPLLDAAIADGTLGGERHAGLWVDVGTPERLAGLDRQLNQRQERQR